ncbi:pentapeptide repeat-containing protein [Aestuariibaculum suncheonense]|uniref:Pentapeptide repeat-containing protein n=1 Tax=Aestuariibaculum suncheonense TaxID=1028745 RepID=A0A8J6QBF3_9FLAO|nr:pentapeptide repeat-containing protein [Aestuariibaculum suncheonense]MBD0836966.1 pentapeptide repeat-containing protein [Aestuariibaculum suncheonense]
MHLVEDQVFEKQDFTVNRLPKGDYDYCTFINCNFSESLLSEIKFQECEFIDCNLSSANITYTSFQDVQFKRCKMLGLHFENCNTFGLALTIDDCMLDHSSFYQVGLKTSRITNTKCVHVDFTEADLSGVNLEDCDFTNATFQNTVLERTDFRKAKYYRIHPEHNKLKGAKFALEGISGLLETYQITIE